MATITVIHPCAAVVSESTRSPLSAQTVGVPLVEAPTCVFCGETTMLELPFPAVKALAAGAFIQDVLPDMPPTEQEVLRSGIHPGCWAAG